MMRRLRLSSRSCLVAILLAAFVLRLLGCFGQGLPFSYYPDERAGMQLALSMGANKSLNPGWFNKPALSYYVLLVEYGAYYAVGRVFGLFESAEDFGARFFIQESDFLLIGRIGNTLFGLATVLLAFRLGLRLGGRRVGLLSALVLALAVGHIDGCQEIKEDVQATFWSMAFLLFLLRGMRSGRALDYAWAGLFGGLGVATKYWPILFLPILWLGFALRLRTAKAHAPRGILGGQWLLGSAAFVLGFFVGSPYNFLSPQWFDESLSRHLRWLTKRMGVDGPWSTLFQAELPKATAGGLKMPSTPVGESLYKSLKVFCSSEGIGPVLALLTLVGLALCAFRPTPQRIVLGISFVWAWFFLSFANQVPTEPRHLMVLYPLAALLSAIGLLALYEMARRGLRQFSLSRRPAVLLSALVVALPIPYFPGFSTLDHARQQLASDPRSQVLAHLERTLEPGTTIMNDHRRLYLLEDEARIDWVNAVVRRDMETAQAVKEQATTAEERREANRRLQTLQRRETEWRFRGLAAERAGRRRFDCLELEHEWMNSNLLLRDFAGAGYSDLWPRSPHGRMLREAVRVVKSADPKVAVTPESVQAAFAENFVHASRVLETRWMQEEGLDPFSPAGFAMREDRLKSRWRGLYGEWPTRLPPPVERWRAATPVSEPWLLRNAQGQYAPVDWFVSAHASYENYEKPERRWHFVDFHEFYADLKAHYNSFIFNEGDEDRERIIRLWDLRQRVETPVVKRLEL